MTALYPVVTDINGIFRGKRLPAQSADKVFKGAMKLPASTLHVDVFGRDALDSGLDAIELGIGQRHAAQQHHSAQCSGRHSRHSIRKQPLTCVKMGRLGLVEWCHERQKHDAGDRVSQSVGSREQKEAVAEDFEQRVAWEPGEKQRETT